MERTGLNLSIGKTEAVILTTKVRIQPTRVCHKRYANRHQKPDNVPGNGRLSSPCRISSNEGTDYIYSVIKDDAKYRRLGVKEKETLVDGNNK